MRKLGILLLFCALSAEADTIVLTATGTYTPALAETYTQIVIAPAPPAYPTGSETSAPCLLLTNTCATGTYSLQLPQLFLPSGAMVTDASLDVYCTVNLADEGSITSADITAVPIIPDQPFSASDGGSHFSELDVGIELPNGAQFGTARGRPLPEQFIGVSKMGIDYTNWVASAVDGQLGLITGQAIYNFGQGGTSLFPGFNSITTIQATWLQSYGSIAGVLTVDYVVTPEPNTLFVIGPLFIALLFYRNKRRPLRQNQ